MAGTKEGSKKSVNTIYKWHGLDFFKNIGRKGGQAKVPKGFSITGKASENGRKGGAKKLISDDQEVLVHKLYLNGMSVSEISKSTSVPYHRVYHSLRKRGLVGKNV